MPPLIRLAHQRDLEAINAIYNHYVPISTSTYDETPMLADERLRWFNGRQPIHPVTVATLSQSSTSAPPASSLQSPASPIVGWGSLHPFRARHGYRFTVENSVYVHPNHQRQGIGSAILADQIARARELQLHAIVAGIDSTQDGSLRLHARHGFIEIARFPQIGRKFDRWLDVVFMQLMLE